MGFADAVLNKVSVLIIRHLYSKNTLIDYFRKLQLYIESELSIKSVVKVETCNRLIVISTDD